MPVNKQFALVSFPSPLLDGGQPAPAPSVQKSPRSARCRVFPVLPAVDSSLLITAWLGYISSVMTAFATLVVVLILGKLGAQLWLERLNRGSVLAHAGDVPDAFKTAIDHPTYVKSVEYTLARARVHRWELACNTVILLAVLYSGVLPATYYWFQGKFGAGAWALGACLFLIAVLLSLPGWPWDWHDQFRLEERFGFNTTTRQLWWLDRAKGLLLALVLGYPLLVLLLKLVEWTGRHWWLWAWGTLMAFQLLMAALAPVLILPLFNKFSPLPEGSLRDRLLALAQRTRFRARSIQVMDGSRRSRHSNAFFTGFGRFRKIVLFDTLVEQLSEPELEAVLAHEIGHYRRKHIPKMLLMSALGSLAGFYAVAVLARQEWFYRSFGFAPGSIVPALLLFSLLAGAVTFWFSPLLHWWSRRYEYEADAFAAGAMNGPDSLVEALRKLNRKNLANLTPHPFYSGFYYSHPTLLEREQALRHL